MTVTPSPESVVEVIENKIMSNNKDFSLSAVSRWCSSNWKAIFAEVVATMLLIVFGCMSCIPLAGHEIQPPLYGPLGFGLAVSFNIQIFGHISGAHMNPAVTLGALFWGSISFALTVAYIIAQCTGAILGYGIVLAVSPVDIIGNGVCLTLPYEGHSLIEAVGIEIVLTSALSFLNCACWDPINKHKQDSVPIKFGLAIVGLSIAGGPLTGASMNPARTLGPAVWTGVWLAHWIYWVGPIIGSVAAAIIYKYIWLNKENKD